MIIGISVHDGVDRLDGYRATTHWAFLASDLEEALKLIELLADAEVAQRVQVPPGIQS
jgi:hypothetical protein